MTKTDTQDGITKINFEDLWEELQSRGIKTRKHLSEILKRDPAHISRFFTASADETTVISICASIHKMFKIEVTGYPNE